MNRRLEIIPLETVERIAAIIGKGSGAAQALAAYRQRRASGERVAVFNDIDEHCWLVGPIPAELDPVKDN